MKPVLAYKPQDYAYKDLLLQFQGGQPLSCDQLNFLYRYENQFNHPALDAVCRYYLKQYKMQPVVQKRKVQTVMLHPKLKFALPTNKWGKRDVQAFKEHLEQIFKTGDVTHVEMTLTPDVFNHLRALTLEKMIYLHGYRLSLHEGFFPGWFPYSIYLQWVDMFGVAKYDLISEPGFTKTMVTLYFEPRQNRLLEECVQDYLIKNHLAFKPANAPPKEQQTDTNENVERNRFTPQLTLSRSKERKEDDQ